jgi:hypothetical protein
MQPRSRPRPDHRVILVPNHNPGLVVLSVSLDDMDVPHWAELPILAFQAEQTDPPEFLVCDWPVTVSRLDGVAWCLLDRETQLCFSPADAVWGFSLPVALAKTLLLEEEKRRVQGIIRQ